MDTPHDCLGLFHIGVYLTRSHRTKPTRRGPWTNVVGPTDMFERRHALARSMNRHGVCYIFNTDSELLFHQLLNDHRYLISVEVKRPCFQRVSTFTTFVVGRYTRRRQMIYVESKTRHTSHHGYSSLTTPDRHQLSDISGCILEFKKNDKSFLQSQMVLKKVLV